MSVEVRFLGAADAALLEAAPDGVFDNAIDPAALRRFLDDDRHHIAVARDAGVTVGFASAVCYEHPDKPKPELWINEVGVADSHQRRGIGKALMRAMLAKARALGCADAWVLTTPDNAAALALYAAAGGGEPADAVMITFSLDEETAR
jgi:aminoglycoside 6'-N-acetyltransferase I